MTTKTHYDFHGDPDRFPILVDFIESYFSDEVRYIADVAGGQGMLTRLLRKRLNLEAEVIDPRGNRMRNVTGQQTYFEAASATYYDLIVGLHPDQATQEIAKSALLVRTLLVPCCNFWDRSQRLGMLPLVEAIEEFFRKHGVAYERVLLGFRGPKNIALVTHPPKTRPDLDRVVMPTLETSGRKEKSWLQEQKATRRKP